MSTQSPHPDPVDERLLDYALGQASPEARARVEKELADDPDLAGRHEDIRNTLRVLDLLPSIEAPKHLADRAVQAVRQRCVQEAADRELTHPVSGGVFSLREAIAIAAAVVLMAFVFVPSVRHARREATRGQCRAQVGTIGAALRTFANGHGGQLPAAAGEVGRWLPAPGAPAVSNSRAMFHLVRARLAPVEAFACPGVADEDTEGIGIEPHMTDFPTPRMVSYSYQHALGPRATPRVSQDLADVASRMAILADATPIFRDNRFLPDRVSAVASDNHQGTGQNVLYLDMHAEWREQPDAGVRGNHIYLRDGVLDYQGDEAPACPTDTFLLPNAPRR